jgi:hypothetical protein
MAGPVFISHSNQDKGAVEQICQILESRGYPCWFAPRNIKAAALWSLEVVRAIRRCRAFVLVLSSNSNQSQEVARELHLLRRKPLIVVRVGDVKPSDGLAFFVTSGQWLDRFARPDAHFEADLVSAIEDPPKRNWSVDPVDRLRWFPLAIRRFVLLAVFAAAMTLATILFFDFFLPAGAPPLRGGPLAVVVAFWLCARWALGYVWDLCTLKYFKATAR